MKTIQLRRVITRRRAFANFAATAVGFATLVAATKQPDRAGPAADFSLKKAAAVLRPFVLTF